MKCLTVNIVNHLFSSVPAFNSGGAILAKQPQFSACALSAHSAPSHAQCEGRGSSGQGSE